jgi:hypothetical protein
MTGASQPVLRRASIPGCLGVLAACAVVLPVRAADWPPVGADDLRMTSEPKAPAAPAIYLYRQVDRDDNVPDETYYARIKILTDAGRKYGDVEIPFEKNNESIRDIEARTIRPDGSIAIFDGTIYEKPILQSRGVKLLAKTFTLPDVQVGSIIEYRYRHRLARGFVLNSHWILSEDLFTRYAKFSLDPYRSFALRFSWPAGLPAGTEPPKTAHGAIRLETHDVPAFVTEEFMPPVDELKQRVDFIYVAGTTVEKDPADFWKKFGKQCYGLARDFTDRPRFAEQTVAQLVAPGDSAELKARKIYARVQQLRNTSYERPRTEQELERDEPKVVKNVEQLWAQGSGDHLQITWTFLALARAAGIEADPVLVAPRNLHFFNPGMMNPADLSAVIVVVKLDGQELYLDPGTPFAPFGMLPWNKTRVAGLRLDKGGGSWVTTPLPAAAQSRIVRKADLHLTANGTLAGKVTVTYTGLEALTRRLEERAEDDTERKQFLEYEIQSDVPTGIDVALTNTPDWSSSEPTLTAVYDLTVPGWAAAAGQRELLAVGLFGGGEKHTFEHAARIHPLYFSFPYESEDDVTIDLPAGWLVSSLPQPQVVAGSTLRYDMAAEKRNGALHVKRELTFNLSYVEVKYYPPLRDFFRAVRTADEEQVVVAPGRTQARR